MTTFESMMALSDLDSYQARIGIDPIERLAWALRFAEQDESQWTGLDREAWRWQLMLFRETPIFWWERLPTSFEVLRERFGRPPQQNVGAFKWHVPDNELMASVRLEFQKILGRLREKGEYAAGPRLHFVIVAGGSRRSPEPQDFKPPLYADTGILSRGELIKVGDFKDSAVFKFCELLAGHAGSLRVCAEERCQRWFADRKPSQRFCSPRCQSRSTTRLYQQRLVAQRNKKTKRGKR
jgi:hypothetical protein